MRRAPPGWMDATYRFFAGSIRSRTQRAGLELLGCRRIDWSQRPLRPPPRQQAQIPPGTGGTGPRRPPSFVSWPLPILRLQARSATGRLNPDPLSQCPLEHRQSECRSSGEGCTTPPPAERSPRRMWQRNDTKSISRNGTWDGNCFEAGTIPESLEEKNRAATVPVAKTEPDGARRRELSKPIVRANAPVFRALFARALYSCIAVARRRNRVCFTRSRSTNPFTARRQSNRHSIPGTVRLNAKPRRHQR
jgi:hypothetical protein